MSGYFSPLTPEDRAFTKRALRTAEQEKGSRLTTQERREVLTRVCNQLKNRNASAMCRAESVRAGTDEPVFSWQPHRPFRR